MRAGAILRCPGGPALSSGPGAGPLRPKKAGDPILSVRRGDDLVCERIRPRARAPSEPVQPNEPEKRFGLSFDAGQIHGSISLSLGMIYTSGLLSSAFRKGEENKGARFLRNRDYM